MDRSLGLDRRPVAKRFVGGKLNVAHNCVDHHVLAGNGDRVAPTSKAKPAIPVI